MFIILLMHASLTYKAMETGLTTLPFPQQLFSHAPAKALRTFAFKLIRDYINLRFGSRSFRVSAPLSGTRSVNVLQLSGNTVKLFISCTCCPDPQSQRLRFSF